MNEIFPLASAAGMTVGLAVCALIIGLVLAMFFAVWESAKWFPVAWTGSALVTVLRGLPEILVVLFIYFGLTAAADAVGRLHDQSWLCADPGADAD
jgi:arginine transport system permease protein